jgi:hypothetical protein
MNRALRRCDVAGLKSGAAAIGVFALALAALPQVRLGIQVAGKPDVEITVSPADPTTKDQITLTVKAEDTSRTGLKRIILLVNDKEVKSCLTSPCSYFGGPFPEGPLKLGAMVYDHTANDPWIGFKMVDVRNPSKPAPNPARTIALLPLAEDPRTRWTDGYLNLPFQGEEEGLQAFVCYRYDADLENDEYARQVLLTRPRSMEAGASLIGIFDIRNLPRQARFRAKVGFLLQTDRTDSAEFKVFVNEDPSDFAAKLCFYDGRLDELALDLERYAGKDVELVLQVRVLDTVTRHLAVWVDPRIEW